MRRPCDSAYICVRSIRRHNTASWGSSRLLDGIDDSKLCVTIAFLAQLDLSHEKSSVMDERCIALRAGTRFTQVEGSKRL